MHSAPAAAGGQGRARAGASRQRPRAWRTGCAWRAAADSHVDYRQIPMVSHNDPAGRAARGEGAARSQLQARSPPGGRAPRAGRAPLGRAPVRCPGRLPRLPPRASPAGGAARPHLPSLQHARPLASASRGRHAGAAHQVVTPLYPLRSSEVAQNDLRRGGARRAGARGRWGLGRGGARLPPGAALGAAASPLAPGGRAPTGGLAGYTPRLPRTHSGCRPHLVAVDAHQFLGQLVAAELDLGPGRGWGKGAVGRGPHGRTDERMRGLSNRMQRGGGARRACEGPAATGADA